MAYILVWDVPQKILDILKRRQAENLHSLQQELLLLLDNHAAKRRQ